MIDFAWPLKIVLGDDMRDALCDQLAALTAGFDPAKIQARVERVKGIG